MRKILCCLTLLLFLPVAALGKTITLIDDETTARQFALCFFAAIVGCVAHAASSESAIVLFICIFV